MKYTEVDLLMAEKIPTLRRKAEIIEHASKKFNEDKLVAHKNLVVKKELMVRLMDKEEAKSVVEGEYSDTYHDVWLAIDWGITWQLEEGQTRPLRYEWDNMVLTFYFPSNAMLREVKFSTCFMAFTKPQRANIISWVRDHLVKKNYKMRKVGIPPHLATADSLVGAAIDDIKHEDMMVQYSNPREYQDKWIYPDERLRPINHDPQSIMQAETLDYFFPSCSDLDVLAYDCLPKTVNQALGFRFFSHRQQVVRLIQSHHKITLEEAIRLKSRGGVAIQALTDFAIQGNTTYSFTRLTGFSLQNILKVNRRNQSLGIEAKSPGRLIYDYVKDLILDKETHHQLVIVFHGNVDFNFAHAACFVRTHNYRNMKQMLLLDCKNKTPIVCPRLGADQMWFSESLKIKEDIVASYHMWEICAIEKR
jgi:hypothetical protein